MSAAISTSRWYWRDLTLKNIYSLNRAVIIPPSFHCCDRNDYVGLCSLFHLRCCLELKSREIAHVNRELSLEMLQMSRQEQNIRLKGKRHSFWQTRTMWIHHFIHSTSLLPIFHPGTVQHWWTVIGYSDARDKTWNPWQCRWPFSFLLHLWLHRPRIEPLIDLLIDWSISNRTLQLLDRVRTIAIWENGELTMA